MTYAILTHTPRHRPGYSSNGVTAVERHSSDFLINGESLLLRLIAIAGGHDDFMGCFVRGFGAVTDSILSEISPSSSDFRPRRVGLYICPECGDIGCGRFSVLIERTADAVVWKEFAYENGYEALRLIEGLGPFRFEADKYKQAVCGASNP